MTDLNPNSNIYSSNIVGQCGNKTNNNQNDHRLSDSKMVIAQPLDRRRSLCKVYALRIIILVKYD